MKSGVCPKCKSRNIIKVDCHRAFPDGSYYTKVIKSGGFVPKLAIPDRYICCDCGYTEEFFRQEDLRELKEKYER